VHGDAPWRFIRDTAKEVMNAIHDTSKDDAPAAPMKKMEGFGGGGDSGPARDEFRNTPSGGGGGGSFGAGGQGNFDARGAPGAVGAFMNKATAVVGQNEFGAKALEAAGAAAGAVGFGQQGAGDAYTAAAGGPGGMPGQPGAPQPGAPPQDGWNSTTTSAQHQQAQAQVKSSMPQRIKVEAGEYEAKIIDDLCEPSGARPNPSKQVLDKFVQQCGSLDANLCCALLEEKLEDEDWKVCLKALVGITALVEKGKDGVVEYFGEGNDEFIKEIVVDPESQKSLRIAAEKCVKAIEKATAEPEVEDTSMDMFSGMMTMDEPAAPAMDMMGGAPAPAAAAPAMDLSFMGNMGGPVVLQTSQAPVPQPTAEEAAPPVDPMFAGVAGGVAAPAAPAPAPAGGMDLLAGFGGAAAPAPAPPAGGLLAGFGGAAAAPAPAPPAAAGGMDMLSMFSAGAPAAAAAPAMGGMGGMMGGAPMGMPGMAPMGQQPMGGMPGMAPMGQMGAAPMGQMPMPGMGAPAPAPAPGGGAFDFLG
jgi:hypothetical protein